MKVLRLGILVFFTCACAGPVLIAQENPSAELYTEAYTDTFQDTFFEALREKGIENYDRARALLLKCKEMDPENPVIDHELAVVMAREKSFDVAETYALAAVLASPSEYWYLNTLMGILRAQYRSPDNVAGFPSNQETVRYNLGRWHVEQEEGGKALEYLQNLPDTGRVLALRQRAFRLEQGASVEPTEEPVVEPKLVENNAEALAEQMAALEASADWTKLKEVSAEATELYPLQPGMFYYKGLALLKLGNTSEAIGELEAAEGLLLQNGPIAKKIFAALERAHRILGNEEKAKQYAEKMKAGL